MALCHAPWVVFLLSGIGGYKFRHCHNFRLGQRKHKKILIPGYDYICLFQNRSRKNGCIVCIANIGNSGFIPNLRRRNHFILKCLQEDFCGVYFMRKFRMNDFPQLVHHIIA